MTFLELLKEHFILTFFAVFIPYILYYISRLYRLGQMKQEESRYASKKILTVEEEQLGIRIENSDPKVYKNRMDNLIDLLQNTKGKIRIRVV